MNENFAIQLFEGKKVRIVWDAEQEKYYFAVADIVQVLTDSADVKQYIKRMRARDTELNSKWGTICTPVEMLAPDGKRRKTQAADLEGIFRIIQSIPSKKAEPVRQWLAEVGSQRIDQMIDPELTFQMAVEDYRRQGYSDRWINERMRSIEMRKELTDEWHRSGIHEPKDFAHTPEYVVWVEEGATFHYDSISTFPKKAAIIVDNSVASSGEELVLDARLASKRTKIYGRDNTMGCVDTGNCPHYTPAGRGLTIQYPISYSTRWEKGTGVDPTGIAPDVRISLPYPKRLADNIDEWVLWVAEDMKR